MTQKKILTLLIIIGILISYVHQMSPSPFLMMIGNEFGIANNDVLLNLSVSIMFPMLVISSLIGGKLGERIGIKKLYSLVLALLSAGMLLNYVANTYFLFLLGRVIYGLGFGFCIPFIGAVIMTLYSDSERVAMNTVNGLFPSVGNLICFASLIPIYSLLGKSWKGALGIWGFAVFFILICWELIVKEQDLHRYAGNSPPCDKTGIYRSLWERKELKLLSVIFMGDFFGYSYIGVILPTYLMEAGSLSEIEAGIWSAVAFPGIGVIGCLIGGLVIRKTSKRKIGLITGSVFKLAGVIIATSFSEFGVLYCVIGIAAYGFGGGFQLPSIYLVPMDLPDMDAVRVGAAFAFISSCAFVCGFISPTIGGLLTNYLSAFSSAADITGQHVFGLKWSLFIFGFSNVITLFCSIKIRETGDSENTGT